MIVKLLTEHHLEFLSLKGGCRGLDESTLVKMPHCWKSHLLAHSYRITPRSHNQVSRCCGYSKEPSQLDGSFEHPRHMFQLMGKKIIAILR